LNCERSLKKMDTNLDWKKNVVAFTTVKMSSKISA